MLPTPRLKDIPALDTNGLRNLPSIIEAIRETLQTFRGVRGDPLDAALTLRNAVGLGVLTSDLAFAGSSGTPGPAGPIGPAGPSGAITPDPTPPPTPTGLAGSAGFSYIYIEHDTPVYTQGHGHDRTVVYGAKWPAGGALPTFASAVKLFEFQGDFGAYPTDTATRWCIWIKWRSVDQYESTAPAGGTNGLLITTTTINGVDLSRLAVSAEKLSVGTYPNINLVPNPAAEDGLEAWNGYEASGAGSTFTADTSTKTGGAASFKLTKTAGGNGTSAVCRGFPVIPGETYSVKLRLKANTASGAVLIRMIEVGAKPADPGFITRTSFTNLYSGNPTTTFDLYEYAYTVPAGVYWAALSVYLWIGGTATTLNFDDCSVGRQITASFMAAGSIAVGTAAIQNGAIVNAMIANATIDNAKIANLAVSKLTAGNMQVGSYIRSTTFVGGTSGFSIEADGSAEFNNITARGAIYASSGSFGGVAIGGALTMNTGGHIKGGQTAYATGTGFFLGYSGAAYKFSIGSSTDYLRWDGSNLSISGDLVGASGTFSGTLTAANIVTTANLVGGAATAIVTGTFSGTGRSTTSVTSRTTTRTLGTITTTAGGDGRVVLLCSPTDTSSVPVWENYNLQAEASLSGNNYPQTITLNVKRNGTVIYTQTTNDTPAFGNTFTRFFYLSMLRDSPGAGVTATYSLEIVTTSSATPGATNHAHEVLAGSVVFLELKR